MILVLRSAIRRLRHLLGIDRAIGFTVLARGWAIVSGALTLLLIARFLTPAEQGYYYTFSSLVALQTVFELGFSFVILQLAAHETSLLHIHSGGEITGDEAAHSRLASVLQKAVRWYSVAAGAMAIFLIVAGYHFFSRHSQSSTPVAWKLPWMCVVVAAVFTFQMDPVFSFLEGCGFVAQVARLRWMQAMAGTLLAWAAFMSHHGLFGPAAIISGQALAGFSFMFSKRHLLLPLLKRKVGTNLVSWRWEIWPFQWRMAVSSFCSYFIFPLFAPVLFAYRGAAEAGRMGISLNIATALGAVAYAWLNTKASPFGNMISRRDFVTLDRTFSRVLVQSASFLLCGDLVVLSAFPVVEIHFSRLASRMLPWPLLGLLMLAVLLNHILYGEAIYLRAHKREPLLISSVVVASLTAISTLVTGRLWGAVGVTIGYFIFGSVLQLVIGTAIFVTRRRQWHADSQPFSIGAQLIE